MDMLNQRQRRFVDTFLVDGNGTQAAIRAGYSPTSARQIATRMMSKASIRAAVADGQGQSARRLQIERLDVIKGLLEAVEMARERCEPAGMIAGLREIGKMMGYYAPARQEVEVVAINQAERLRLEAMSDEELLALLGPTTAAA